ncbi:MAG TPA: glycoside hydrolase domain-containing protein, partial [Gammaproteobacteria bacterium]|nr:glycoside hydrolase domain-containing protein [Gammaproteobacteria bacterium]
QYVIGRPFVKRATLTLPNGRHFTVEAHDLSDSNSYVGSVTLNGKPLKRVYITQSEIMAGGVLKFVMQAQPNKTWGTSIAGRPFAMSPYAQ